MSIQLQTIWKTLGLSLVAMTIHASPALALNFDSDVPQATQQQITQDLGFMASVSGSKTSKLHQEVFGPMQGAGYVKWFSDRVLSVGYTDSDMGGAVAYVSPFMDSTKMVLTKNFTSFDHPQIARLMVVFHEARHTENESGNWPHATCPTPFNDVQGHEIKSIWTGLPLAGQAGCDEKAIGAYGSSLILLKNISLFCENCNEKVKMDAQIFADDQLNRIISSEAHEALRTDLNGQ